MYKTGIRIAPNSPFSKDNVKERITFYNENTDRIRATGWARLLTSYGVESSSSEREDDEDDMDEQVFRDLYAPSSPIPGP
jgi:hypothetical protein